MGEVIRYSLLLIMFDLRTYLLFSAKIMGQNDVLEITGGFDDENRSFAIEFTNGGGERVLYYIQPGELSAEP